MAPWVPAYRWSIGIVATHPAQTNDSYSEPLMRGGGRHEEEALD